jgi:PAS domain S-box-containing protein
MVDDLYKNILKLIPDAVILIREYDGVILDINDACEKLTGYGRNEISRYALISSLLSSDPDLKRMIFQYTESEREVDEKETRIVNKNGIPVPVTLSLRSIEINGMSCRLIMLRKVRIIYLTDELWRGDIQSFIRKPEKNFFCNEESDNAELAGIIDVEAVQSLMDDFYKLARIPMSISDLNGRILIGVGWQDICVKFHRINPHSCSHCIESDTKLSAGVGQGDFRLYRCKNNMWDIATPLIIGGKHVGNIFSGQFFFDDEPLDYDLFRSQARQYGFNEDEYIKALEAVPRLSWDSVKTGMSFFMKLAYLISQLSYSNMMLAKSHDRRNDAV